MGESDAHLADREVDLAGRLVCRAYELGPLSFGAGLGPLELVGHRLAATAAEGHHAITPATSSDAASCGRRAQQADFVEIIGVGVASDLACNNANPYTSVLTGPNSLNLAILQPETEAALILTKHLGEVATVCQRPREHRLKE